MAEAVTHLTEGLAVLQDLAWGKSVNGISSVCSLRLVRPASPGRALPLRKRAKPTPEPTNSALRSAMFQSSFQFSMGDLCSIFSAASSGRRTRSRANYCDGREQGNVAAQLIGHRMVGSALCQYGRFAESRDAFEAALALYDPVRDRDSGLVYAIDSRVMCLSWLSHLYLILGDPEQALPTAGRCRPMCMSLSILGRQRSPWLGDASFISFCETHTMPQHKRKAAIALGTEQGFPLYRATGSVVHGWAQAEVGRVAEGLAEMQQGLADYRATGAEMWSPYFLGLLADASRRGDRAQEGLGFVDDALTQIQHTGGRWIEAELHRVRGELLLAGSEPDQQEAELCFQQALALARDQNARLWELQAATSLARLWGNQDRTQAAHDLLTPICSLFEDGMKIPALRDAKTLLDELTLISRDRADHLNP